MLGSRTERRDSVRDVRNRVINILTTDNRKVLLQEISIQM